MRIEHVTLSTGRRSHIVVGDVNGETQARVRPWLSALVATEAPMPLPVSTLASYTALAKAAGRALLVTVHGPHAQGLSGPPPLVTLGVEPTKNEGDDLWPMLTGSGMPPVSARLQQSEAPWAAVILWPALERQPDAVRWLDDLQRCIAWTWCTA